MSENPSIWGELAGLTLTKGHGTGNDFIFLTDENAEIALTPELVARACDRHFGIGADGFIRVARSTASRAGQKLLEEHPDAVWFMDYRNGDGSIAEMCGNGVRAFVEYLRTEGLIELEVGETLSCGTGACTGWMRSHPPSQMRHWLQLCKNKQIDVLHSGILGYSRGIFAPTIEEICHSHHIRKILPFCPWQNPLRVPSTMLFSADRIR